MKRYASNRLVELELTLRKFSFHLNLAQESLGIFENDKLPVVATVEQVCLVDRRVLHSTHIQ